MNENKNRKIGGLLLAAGGSQRLGQPKQFLILEGKTLLRRAVEAMIGSVCEPVIVVLGAESKRAKDELAGLPVHLCINENWRAGMSSSIKAGVNEILAIEPEISAVLVTLCDQPFVTADKINLLAAKFSETGKSIVASEYGDTIGVPALFSREVIDELSQIEGDKGARDLIRSGKYSSETVAMPEAAIDIDSPDDLDRLLILNTRS